MQYDAGISLLKMNISQLEFIGRDLRPVELRLLARFIFRIRRKEFRLPDQRMYWIDPVSDLGLQLLKNKAYEPEMTRVIEELLVAGDTFVDLGSNEGYFAILAGKKCGEAGKVIAIEPQERLWGIIRKNCMLNELKNVELLPYGIGSRKEKRTLHLYPSTNSGASSFSENFNFRIAAGWLRKFFYGSQEVDMLCLDDLRSYFPDHVRLLKIDIEGYELEALKGAVSILKERVFKNILIEVHPEALAGLRQHESEIDAWLISFGYVKQVIAGNLNLFSIR